MCYFFSESRVVFCSFTFSMLGSCFPRDWNYLDKMEPIPCSSFVVDHYEKPLRLVKYYNFVRGPES